MQRTQRGALCALLTACLLAGCTGDTTDPGTTDVGDDTTTDDTATDDTTTDEPASEEEPTEEAAPPAGRPQAELVSSAADAADVSGAGSPWEVHVFECTRPSAGGLTFAGMRSDGVTVSITIDGGVGTATQELPGGVDPALPDHSGPTTSFSGDADGFTVGWDEYEISVSGCPL